MEFTDTLLARLCLAIFLVPLACGVTLVFWGRRLPRGGAWGRRRAAAGWCAGAGLRR